MATVILNTTNKSGNLANGAQLQVNYSTSYNAETNKTTLKVDSLAIKNTSITLQMRIHGQLACNGQVIVDWENDSIQLTDEKWVTITSGSRYSIELPNGETGALTLTFAPKTKDTTYPNAGGTSDGIYIAGSPYYFKFGESETVTADASQTRMYSLSIQAGTGSAITVTRSGSALANGSAIYHGDVLTVSFAALTGYKLTSATVNGTSNSGGSITVSGDVTVVAAAAVLAFSLNLQSPAKTPTVVTRKSSPLKGAALGELSHGSTIYYGDVLSLAVTIPSGYAVTTTINGAYVPPNTDYTVTGAVVIIVTAKAQGFISVADGNAYIGYKPSVGGAVYIAKIT